MRELEKILDKELSRIIKKYLKKQSGDLLKSISTKVIIRGNVFKVSIKSKEYIQYHDKVINDFKKFSEITINEYVINYILDEMYQTFETDNENDDKKFMNTYNNGYDIKLEFVLLDK